LSSANSLPRKLGQHFLVQESILEQLATSACGAYVPRAVEIGPGRGALTRHLLPRTDELHAVELDSALVEFLRRKFDQNPRFHVHHGDVLETDLAQWGAAAIIGNLPYYITSPIIEKFLALDERFPTALFLMQWEVAQRVLSGPNSRDYGYLSVAVQLTCEVSLVCKVAPGAFSPPPKVDSAAVKFVRRVASPANLPALLKLVSRCFAQKRKTLRNNLRPFYGDAANSLPEAGLRAEQLSIEQFIELERRLAPATGLD
jgi:16S rRNA (adenine1518-N6/adenine1519-N6)-dimethyltransferase